MEQCEHSGKEEEDFLPVDKHIKRPKTRCLKVLTLTWNVNSKPPPQDELPNFFVYTADVYVFSFQELGTHDWISALDSCLSGEDVVRIKSRRLQGIMIVVYVQRHLLNYVTHIESEVTRTGLGGIWGNKGGVSIRFDLRGINVIFVNSHLAAHAPNVAQRIQDVTDIIDHQKFRDDDVECILDHDYIFWMGDLNFRVDLPYETALSNIETKSLTHLLLHDQLKNLMKEGLIFNGFKEAPIHFKPTYKFDVGTNDYDTSVKRRVPSYCDRILYFYHDVTYGKRDKLNVNTIYYHSHPSFKYSDHKPVTSMMEILVLTRPSINPITFNVGKTITRLSSLLVTFSSHHMELTSSDWIGIYHAKFHALSDYISYQYVQFNRSHISGYAQFPQSVFSNLPQGSVFVLCFFSKKNSFSGVSKEFKLKD